MLYYYCLKSFKSLLSIIFSFTYLQKLVSFDVDKSSMLTMKLEYLEIKLGVLLQLCSSLISSLSIYLP